MIEALKTDDIMDKVGGRFRLAALVQKRWLDLLNGAPPLIEVGDMTLLEVAVEEVYRGKLTIDYDASHLATPEQLRA